MQGGLRDVVFPAHYEHRKPLKVMMQGCREMKDEREAGKRPPVS